MATNIQGQALKFENMKPETKFLADGRALLNVACSFRTHRAWNNVDFSAYARLAHHKIFARFLNECGVLSNDRYARILATDSDIILHDLRRGIPFPEEEFDVIYHSHFLEHLEKQDAFEFLKECWRVLKKGGIIRVVVPDLEAKILNYVSETIKLAKEEVKDLTAHQNAVHKLFDQMLMTTPGGTRQQSHMIRFFERILRGDTAKTGELHRWMYDKYSLKNLLSTVGFRDISLETASSSRVSDWKEFMLDANANGTPFHSDSLYMEGIKR